MSQERTSRELLDILVAKNVLQEENSALRLSSAFSTHLSTIRDSLSIPEQRTELLDEELPATKHNQTALLKRHDGPLAEYIALATYTAELTHEERLNALIVFDQFYRDPPPVHGAPDSFVPVHADRLAFLLERFEKTTVYVWLDDCSPCERMKRTFEEKFDNQPEEVVLFSVYGPDWASLLQEEYSIPGGPVALFTRNGRIDARVYGTESDQVLENEIDRHLGHS